MLGRESVHKRAVHALVITTIGFAFPSAASATVLIFGDRATSRNALEADLAGLGESVTNVVSLPVDLSPYNVVWHVSAFTALAVSEQERLSDFVSGGGGLHLSGEQICCETMNDSLEAIINSVVIGGGVLVGGQGNPVGPYTFNAGALEGVTITPNPLSTWTPTVPGAMGGSIGAAEVLVSTAGGQILGAAWDEDLMTSGRGRLSILMDVDWFLNTNHLAVVDNLQTFLSVPEPAALSLLGAAVLLMRRRRS